MPGLAKMFWILHSANRRKRVAFTANKEYNKGQVIIKDESLLVSKADFTSKTTFDASNWEKYTKHDYAIFNPLHTWVEYINRLCGALAGIACFITFILSFGYWKNNKKLVLLTFLVCILMGFQAWLGKTVVDSALNPFKITIHMLAALLIVAFQLIVIYAVQNNRKSLVFNSKFNWLLIVSLILTLVQVVLGTNVREHVDTISKTGAPEVMWLQFPNLSFYIHRTFSVIVLAINLYLFAINNKLKLGFSKMNWVLVLLSIEIISGIAMYYFDFPFGTQTIHIVLATLLFGVQFYLILESKAKKTIL